MSWQPSADITILIQRAEFIAQIRNFFVQKQVLEVETPLLSRNTITDLHLDPFVTSFEHDNAEGETSLYLQTSPEFHMKRLLAAGSGPIFQLCKAFRNEAAGTIHNPEFTMLEWYRPGFDDHQLMAELDELVQSLLGTAPALRMTYQEAFVARLNIDPLSITLEQLKLQISTMSDDQWLQVETNKDTLLQWLFSMFIEPELGKETNLPCIVYNFPATQAALAKVNKDMPLVAHRFELYFQGVELANGYYELQDWQEQNRRFEVDNILRAEQNKPKRQVDQNLLMALQHGLPDCAGVALGIDRLFMLKQKCQSIADTVSFDINRA